MKDRYPGYVVKQVNIIVDVLGGYSLEVRNKMKELFGEKRARECLMKMQNSILSSTLNIARCFKTNEREHYNFINIIFILFRERCINR